MREGESKNAIKPCIPQKAIAADMDYSPSTLSRKLAQNPDDSQKFTLDDLETYMQTTSDTQPVLYLVEKYLTEKDTDELKRQIQSLQDQLAEKTKKRTGL
jgi:hypothetical protein